MKLSNILFILNFSLCLRDPPTIVSHAANVSTANFHTVSQVAQAAPSPPPGPDTIAVLKSAKRGKSPFNVYVAQEMPKLVGMAIPDRMREVGKKWKGMTEQQKQKYSEIAAKENLANPPVMISEDERRLARAQTLKRKARLQLNKLHDATGRPKQDPTSGYRVFLRDFAQKNSSNKEFNVLIEGAKAWSKLSENEKERCAQIGASNKSKFDAELAVWLKKLDLNVKQYVQDLQDCATKDFEALFEQSTSEDNMLQAFNRRAFHLIKDTKTLDVFNKTK